MSMIKVTVGTTTNTKSVVVDSSTVIEDLLNAQNISTAGCTVTLDSAKVTDLKQSLEEAGAGEECFLFSIVNSKNA